MGKVIKSAEVLFVDGADVPVTHKYADHMVVLRDADNPDDTWLCYTPSEWEAFILGVKDGEFDDLAVVAEAPESGPSDSKPSTPFPWVGRPGYRVGGDE